MTVFLTLDITLAGKNDNIRTADLVLTKHVEKCLRLKFQKIKNQC